MRFFVDNNLSPQLAKGMEGFGQNVVHLTDHFPADTEDTEWLAHIGEKGWILITRDERIRFRPGERAALKEHEVGAFFMGGKNRNACQLIQQLVRNWPQIKERARSTKRPFAFRVRPTGGKFDRLPLK